MQRIDADLKDRMAYNWRRGCPVPRWKLRYVTVTYVDFKGAARQGELVVHKAVAADLVGAFEAMYDARFRIKRMRLVDDYEGSDAASMAANNTSAFNCRRVARTTRWSEHAYGKAIDINPVRNPYVDGDRVAPTARARRTSSAGRCARAGSNSSIGMTRPRQRRRVKLRRRPRGRRTRSPRDGRRTR